MKVNLRQVKILSAAVLLAVGGSALAQVANTLHDLSSGSTSTSKSTTSTDEICVFCHTPHGASATVKPLWNRTASALTYLQVYANDESMDSANLGPNAGSIACLSCHDGSVAMDSILNKPGSGTGAPAGYAWAGTSFTSKKISSAAGNLSNDLRDDHPIGVAYCGGFVTAGGSCVDSDFVTATLFKNGSATGSMAVTATVTDKWWIETGANSTRNKTDLIMYARSFTQTGAGAGTFVEPSVECATCHDVHGGVTGTTFLRKSNAASGLCLACHVK